MHCSYAASRIGELPTLPSQSHCYSRCHAHALSLMVARETKNNSNCELLQEGWFQYRNWKQQLLKWRCWNVHMYMSNVHVALKKLQNSLILISNGLLVYVYVQHIAPCIQKVKTIWYTICTCYLYTVDVYMHMQGPMYIVPWLEKNISVSFLSYQIVQLWWLEICASEKRNPA